MVTDDIGRNGWWQSVVAERGGRAWWQSVVKEDGGSIEGHRGWYRAIYLYMRNLHGTGSQNTRAYHHNNLINNTLAIYHLLASYLKILPYPYPYLFVSY